MEKFWLDIARREFKEIRQRVQRSLSFRTKDAFFVVEMAFLSVLPFAPLFLNKVVGLPFNFAPWQVGLSAISVLIFGIHASQNKSLPDILNLFFTISFAFTCCLSLPIYWFVGVLLPYLEKTRGEHKVDTERVWTLFLSIAPILAFLGSTIASYFFPTAAWIPWAPLLIAFIAILYFAYHVIRHPFRSLNKELFWILSFFLTASLSLPLYWFKRIYKPTLFPANVEVEAHELWGGMVELEDESSNSKTLGYEKTAEEEMGFSSFDVPEDLKVRVQKNIRKGSSKKLKHRKKAKRGTKKGGKKK